MGIGKLFQQKLVLKVIVLLLVVVVGEIIFVHFTIKKIASDYEILTDLKHIRLLDQKLTQLYNNKISYRSYDDVVNSINLLRETIAKLEQYDVFNKNTAESIELSLKYQKLKIKLQRYIEIIEHFKSWNSVTINSIRYLFDLHSEIQSYVYRAENLSSKDQISFFLDETINTVAKFNFDRADNLIHLKYSISELLKLSKKNKTLYDSVKVMALHSDIIINGLNRIADLEKENDKLTLGKDINRIYNLLLIIFESKDEKYEYIINFLQAIVLFLIMLLLIAYQKEVRSQTQIGTLNERLKEKLHNIEVINQQMSKFLHQFDINVIASSTDAFGNITYASRAFSQISGYSTDELIGANHNIVRHPDMPKSLYQTMWKTIQSGKIWSGEVKNLKKQGGYYWVNVTITPEFDNNDHIIGYNAIRHDITAQKELEQLSKTLEQKVEERTEELQEMVKSVEKLSITDELTGLYNRRYYGQIIDREIRRTIRNKELFCYMSVDLDHFKAFNDTYGHFRGDELLKQISETMQLMIQRPDDYIFRMGGEEFTIIFSVKDVNEAVKLAEKIIRKIELLQIEHSNNPPYNVVTVSAGLVVNSRYDADINEDDIYKQADLLLYQSKSKGRNCLRYKLN